MHARAVLIALTTGLGSLLAVTALRPERGPIPLRPPRPRPRPRSTPWRPLFDRPAPPRLALVTCGGAFDALAREHRNDAVVTAEPVRG